MTATMTAGAYLGAGNIKAIDKPRPEVGDGEILIKVSKAGICGTDMHTYRHGSDFMPEGLTIGHEFSGTVVEVGAGVGDITPGMRVTANPMVDHLGLFTDGAFAEYLRFPNARLGETVFALDDAVSDTEAALAEPLAVALRGVKQSRLNAESTVLIQGLGTIGLGALLLARQRGVEKIVAIDTRGCRLALAASLGASTMALDEEDIDQRLAEIFGMAPGLIPSPNIDVVIDATGSEAAMASAINRLAPKGELLVLGTYSAPITVDMTFFVAKELRMVGSLAYEEEFPEALSLIKDKQVDVSVLASHEFSLADIDKAFEMQADSSQSIKVMLDMTQS